MPDSMPSLLAGLPKCKTEGCQRVLRTMGYCHACYLKFRLVRETRRCACGGVHYAKYALRDGSGGKVSVCRPCYFQMWRRDHKDKVRAWNQARMGSTKELDALAIFIEAFDIRGEDGVSAEHVLAGYILWLRPMLMREPKRGAFRRRELEMAV